MVTTLAGSQTSGKNDGANTAASFNQPKGIAVGVDGTIFVSDTGNHLIRMISATGTSFDVHFSHSWHDCNNNYLECLLNHCRSGYHTRR